MPAENPLLTQLKQLNEKLTLNQKISILALAAAILTGVGLMVYFMGQEEYQTLFRPQRRRSQHCGEPAKGSESPLPANRCWEEHSGTEAED